MQCKLLWVCIGQMHTVKVKVIAVIKKMFNIILATDNMEIIE